MTHEEIRSIYESVIQKQEQMKALDAEIRSLKNSIMEYHNGEPVMVIDDEFQSKMKACTRMTLLEAQVQSKYNIEFQPEDYKVTPYTTLSVSRVKKA